MLKDVVAPFSDLDPRNLPCNGGTTREVPVSESAQWQGAMLSGLGNIAIPEPDIIKPPISVTNGGAGDPGVYREKAGLRIVMRTGPGITGQLPGAPAIVLPHRIEVVSAGGAVDAV